MAQDPVLQREMFNTRGRSAKGSGITSMVDDGSSGMTREERMQMAKDMLAEAQMKQTPEYYFNTLAASDRPAMTRPVASSAPPPAMQQMPAAQQMAQMQAAGVRPVGMADGGMVRHGYVDGSLVTPSGPMSYDELMAQYAESGNVDRRGPTMLAPTTPIEGSEYDAMGNYIGVPQYNTQEVPFVSPFKRKLSTTPSASQRELTDADRGILSIKKPTETEKPIEDPTKKEEPSPPADKKQTELEQIKADRKAEKERNFYLGLMQAGLAVAAGKSPDALQNIAQGGISGLQSYAGLEADSRKAEREDMAALRAQQQDEATALYREKTLGLEREKMDRAPEAVLAAAMAGGYNPESGKPPTKDEYTAGLAVLSRSKTLSEVNDQLTNLLKVQKEGGIVDPEEVTTLRAARDQLMLEMGVGKPQPAFSGFSGTTVAP
jgi:hypothetical protein